MNTVLAEFIKNH
jgi:hypothetical protein